MGRIDTEEARITALSDSDLLAEYWAESGGLELLVSEVARRGFDGWRPINSAPKDGTWFLADCPEMGCDIVHWNHQGWQNQEGLSSWSSYWHPLPAVPQMREW